MARAGKQPHAEGGCRGTRSQAKSPIRLIEEQAALDGRMEAEARQVAHRLLPGYIGPDHKVLNMPSFYSALTQALRAARAQGQVDSSGQQSAGRSSLR